MKKKLIFFLMMIPFLTVFLIGTWGYFAVSDPLKINFRERSLPPDRNHLFGTDDIGCDMLRKTTLAIRITLLISISAVLFSMISGVFLGSFCGFYHGGVTDSIICAFSDILLSFPNFFLILIMVAVMGNNLSNLVIVLALGYFPTVFRMVRSEVMTLKQSEFVQAARTFGAGWGYLFLKHILICIRGNVTAVFLAGVGTAIVTESALSFLGLGVPMERPSLGSLIAGGRNYLNAWWLSFFPGLMIFMLNLSFQWAGEGFRRKKES